MSGKQDTQPKHKRNVTVDSLFIGTEELKDNPSSVQKAWYTDLDIGNVTLKFKLDSGAEANIIPLDIYQSLYKTVLLQPTSTMLVAYGGTKLKAAVCHIQSASLFTLLHHQTLVHSNTW